MTKAGSPGRFGRLGWVRAELAAALDAALDATSPTNPCELCGRPTPVQHLAPRRPRSGAFVCSRCQAVILPNDDDDRED